MAFALLPNHFLSFFAGKETVISLWAKKAYFCILNRKKIILLLLLLLFLRFKIVFVLIMYFMLFLSYKNHQRLFIALFRAYNNLVSKASVRGE